MPTAPHRTKWHHVNDAKIRKITSDPEGGVATFDDWVDVPGIKTIGVGGTVNITELRGDNALLDQYTILTGVSVSFNHAKLSLDVLAIILGGSVVDSGVTPNEEARYSRNTTDALNYWEMRARTTGTDAMGGDGVIELPKCVANGFPDIGFAEEDYRTFTGGAACIPRLSDGAWFDIVTRNTAAEIA